VVIKNWSRIHRWSSLACTVFLVLICLTGLPLIFSSQIDHWLDRSHYAPVPSATSPTSLDRFAAIGRRMYPGQIIISIFLDDDAPAAFVRMAPSLEAVKSNPALEHLIRFDLHTTQILGEGKRVGFRNRRFTDLLLIVHRSLFAGPIGELLIGIMGALFLVAIISGAVLYAPFNRKVGFGVVRTGRSRRIYWLDLHNFLGIVTLAWVLVVGATGVMNELAGPLFGIWQRTEVQETLAPYAHQPPLGPSELSSPQRAVDAALRAQPQMQLLSIGFPDPDDGSPWHYLVWLKGTTPLTSRLFSPVLIDARTGALTAVIKMPWYLRALEIARPLHFGDYGGLPLQIIWALLDLLTLVILGSGVYLWIARRKNYYR
jgi:uncharacterized iron-regulated membrane protein